MTDETIFFNSIREILKINRITREERKIIDEWRKEYSNTEILEALKKAALSGARIPLGTYTAKILAENQSKRQKAALLPKYKTESQPDTEEENLTIDQLRKIERFYERVLLREKAYIQNGYGGNLVLEEKRLKEIRQEIQAMKGE